MFSVMNAIVVLMCVIAVSVFCQSSEVAVAEPEFRLLLVVPGNINMLRS